MKNKIGNAKSILRAAALFAGMAVSSQALAQQGYYGQPYYGYDRPTSILPSEGQLQAAGCGLINRDFQRGTMLYECRGGIADGPIGYPGANSGPRCVFAGAARNEFQSVVRFVCRENVTNYDHDYGQGARRDVRPYYQDRGYNGGRDNRHQHNGRTPGLFNK